MLTRVAVSEPFNGDWWPAVELLTGDPGRWLPRPARQCGARAWRTTLRAGPLAREVVVTVGVPWTLPDAVGRTLTWMPAGSRGTPERSLHPEFAGQVVLRRTDAGRVVELSGAYRPPLGALGAVLDLAVMRSLASATLRRLVRFLVHEAEAVDARL